MSGQKIINPNMAVKRVQNTCKSAQTSTKYCSVTMQFGQNVTWHTLILIAEVLGLHLVYQIEVDQWIHNLDSDSSHNTSESVDLTNLDSTDYGCEIRLLVTVQAKNINILCH